MGLLQTIYFLSLFLRPLNTALPSLLHANIIENLLVHIFSRFRSDVLLAVSRILL